jgi:hypothetical protein
MTAWPGPSPAPIAYEECANCRELLAPGARFCTTCGQALAGGQDRPASVAPQQLACGQCGAVVAMGTSDLTLTCPFCDTPYAATAADGTAPTLVPEFVLPFSVPRAAAEERFAAWRSGVTRWRDPAKLAELGSAQVRGVYVPHWGFQGRVASRWSARIGEYYQARETYTEWESYTDSDGRSQSRMVTKTRTVTRVDWNDLSGQGHAYYPMHVQVASRGLPQALLDEVGTFPLEELQPYDPGYLLGWLAELPGRDRAECLDLMRERILAEERQRVSAYLPGDVHELTDCQAELSDVFTDLVLLPLWIASVHDGAERHHFLLNGRTGRAAGQAPPWDRHLVPALLVILVATLVLAVLLVVALSRAQP